MSCADYCLFDFICILCHVSVNPIVSSQVQSEAGSRHMRGEGGKKARRGGGWKWKATLPHGRHGRQVTTDRWSGGERRWGAGREKHEDAVCVGESGLNNALQVALRSVSQLSTADGSTSSLAAGASAGALAISAPAPAPTPTPIKANSTLRLLLGGLPVSLCASCSFCRWASLTLATHTGLISSQFSPATHTSQFRSRCSWTSLGSRISEPRCLASWHDDVTTRSTKSFAIATSATFRSPSRVWVVSILLIRLSS
jgi:hypothetical protein